MGVFTRSDQEQAAPLIAALDTPRTITAGSQRIRVDDRQAMEKLRNNSSDVSWQHRSWLAYDTIGEIHFGFNLMANIISRIRFYPAAIISPNVAPAFVGDTSDLTPGIAEAAVAAVNRLARGNGDMGILVRELALNMCIPGECYLVQMPARTELTPEGTISHPERWEIRSTDEVVVSADPKAPVKIRNRADTTLNDTVTLPPRAYIGRIWRRHPRWSAQADSSMRAILDLCDELLVLNQTFKATARSRLNSGLLFVPDGLSASSPTADAAAAAAASPKGDKGYEDTYAAPVGDDDEFEMALMDGMMTPIQDPSDASAVVPILVRGPAELGDKIRYITFERVFDPSLVQRADRVLERILQGIDLPKDVVSGLANVRYSNAIQIEESLFKAHVEPLALLICDALTDIYLRPAIQAHGYTMQQAERVRFWYDPSEVVTRPNRNNDATSAYDRYALSARSFREALGFNEDDAPTPTEVLMRMLQQKGPITPELAEALMRVLAPMLMEAARSQAAEASGNALPAEVQDVLFGGSPAEAPAPAPEAAPPEPEGEASPTVQEVMTPSAPPKVQGPRSATPATPQTVAEADQIPGLPPFPRS